MQIVIIHIEGVEEHGIYQDGQRNYSLESNESGLAKRTWSEGTKGKERKGKERKGRQEQISVPPVREALRAVGAAIEYREGNSEWFASIGHEFPETIESVVYKDEDRAIDEH